MLTNPNHDRDHDPKPPRPWILTLIPTPLSDEEADSLAARLRALAGVTEAEEGDKPEDDGHKRP